MNQLEITGLRTKTRIGIYAWEQQIRQELKIDMTIPITQAIENDLNKTIDYQKLCEMVTDFIESNAFELIETVAEQIADLIQTHFHAPHLTLRVSKPHAIPNASNISFLIQR